MKYYAVRVGRTTGIFENWAECNEAIKGFSGADFKSFASLSEAEAYINGEDLWDKTVSKDAEDGYLVAFCDGSFDESLGRYSYGVLLIDPEGHENEICGYGSNSEYISSKNIIGEIFGVINALDWAVSNGYSKVKIYHDYEGLSKWISGGWSAKSRAAQMFVSVFQTKFEGLLEVQFEKVKGHSNNRYNDRVDELATAALQDKTKKVIQGDNWFVLPYFSEKNFDAIVSLIQEADDRIIVTTNDYPSKKIYKFELDDNKTVATQFKSRNHKVLIQGKNSLLFQIIISIIIELDESVKIEPILCSAYRKSIDEANINNTLKAVCPNFPGDYPVNVKRLVRQAIINLKYYVESEDYSQYTFPALRALEGHIKYIIKKAGGLVGRSFSSFTIDPVTQLYCYSGTLTDASKKSQIEKCYNYYHANRHTIFHFGDIIGATDSTRVIETKEEADEIIKKCIELISEL